MGRYHHMYGDGWPLWLGVLLMLLFWAVLIVGGVLLVRWAVQRGPRQPPAGPAVSGGPRPGPERLLAERFARGEIDETEYRSRLAVLREDPGAG